MLITEQIDCSAPAVAVFAPLDDPAGYLHFLSGFTRWEIVGEQETGVGARYRMLMRVGAAEVGGLVEVVEWVPQREIAWTSVTGVDQRGRWRIREREPGLTRVELRMSYGVAGAGIFGLIAERYAAPTVRDHLRRTLRQLKRHVEQQQLRERAAARRRARETA